MKWLFDKLAQRPSVHKDTKCIEFRLRKWRNRWMMRAENCSSQRTFVRFLYGSVVTTEVCVGINYVVSTRPPPKTPMLAHTKYRHADKHKSVVHAGLASWTDDWFPNSLVENVFFWYLISSNKCQSSYWLQMLRYQAFMRSRPVLKGNLYFSFPL